MSQEKPRAPEHKPAEGFCAKAVPALSDGHSTCILVVAIFFGPLGLWFASCMDENGCNCDTFLLGLLMGFLPFLGWFWAIYWAWTVRAWNIERNAWIAGGGKNTTEPLMEGAPAAQE